MVRPELGEGKNLRLLRPMYFKSKQVKSQMLVKIINSPWLSLVSGIILLITSGIEVYDKIGAAHVGAHHGILIFALVQVIRTLPEFHHAAKEIGEGRMAGGED